MAGLGFGGGGELGFGGGGGLGVRRSRNSVGGGRNTFYGPVLNVICGIANGE